MKHFLAPACLAMLSVSTFAYADTTYDFNAAYNLPPSDTGSVMGTITFSSVTGLVVSADLTDTTTRFGSEPAATLIDNIEDYNVPTVPDDPLFQYVVVYNGAGDGSELALLSFPDGNIVVCLEPQACDGYSGVNTGHHSLYAFDYGATVDLFTSASLTLPAPPTASTPEPSSLMLLGSGLLAAGGVSRRRYFSR